MLSLASSINSNSSALLAEAAILQFKTELDGRSEMYESLSPEQLIEPIITAHQKEAAERPNNPELHYRLGILMTATQHPREAQGSFEAALTINPTYVQARNKLALCLYDINQKESALHILPGPSCLDRDILDLHYKTALLYCDRVKFASTLLNLDQTLSRSFTALDPAMNIAVILQNLCLLDRTTAAWDSLAGTAERAIDSGSAFNEGQV
jgi:tetratricopeptide (TPR) repeat protein